jgi:hypothetical protein
MQYPASSFSRRLFKPLAFSLALFSLLFLIQIVPHAHADHHDEATCRICQVAHLGVTPAVSAISFSVPFIAFDRIAPTAILALSQSFSSLSSSRAPPSNLLS